MILTDAERQNFLALPTDDDTLIRHWSLNDEDHRLLETRRRDDTRLGLALQLCALRHPGHLIQRGEIIPESSLTFLADQLQIEPEALATFAQRAPSRYEQLAVLRQHYGFSELSHSARADLLAFARGVANCLDQEQIRRRRPCG
jgi:TnpA family transposase